MEKYDPLIMLVSIALGTWLVHDWHLKHRPKPTISLYTRFAFIFIRIVGLVLFAGFLAFDLQVPLLLILIITFACSALILSLMSAGISFTGDVFFALFLVGMYPFHFLGPFLLIVTLPLAGLQLVLLGTEKFFPDPPRADEGTGHAPKPHPKKIVPEPSMIGQIGIAATALRPSGKIKMDGRLYEAISGTAEFIDAGEQVIVSDLKMAALEVKRVTPSEVRQK